MTRTFTVGLKTKFSDNGWTKDGSVLFGWAKDKNATTRTYTTTATAADSFIQNNSPTLDLYAVWVSGFKISFDYNYLRGTESYPPASYLDTSKWKGWGANVYTELGNENTAIGGKFVRNHITTTNASNQQNGAYNNEVTINNGKTYTIMFWVRSNNDLTNLHIGQAQYMRKWINLKGGSNWVRVVKTEVAQYDPQQSTHDFVEYLSHAKSSNTVFPSNTYIDVHSIQLQEGNVSLYKETKDYKPDQSISFPTPTRTGFRFVGWYTKAIGGDKISSAKATKTCTYYAHWEVQ